MSIVKEKLDLLKRKRSTIRVAITKLTTKVNDPTSEKTDLEYSVKCLQDKINELTLADDKTNELLNDEEYNEDMIGCEKCTENAHLAMFTYKRKANTNANFSSPSLCKCFSLTQRQVQFQLSRICVKSKVNIIAFESLNKYASHPLPPTDVSRFTKNKRLKLADPDDSLSNLPIDILIGVDFYRNIVNSEPPVKLSDSLTFIPSIFGCILSGLRSHTTVSFIPTVHNINVDTSTQALEDVVREFWSLESISMQPIQEEKSTCNSELLTNFHQSFEIIDGRRVVKLPWKPEVKLSSNNYEVAI
ncbi:DUF1758 domain-containing protein [Nephila pilipes]|uniref:DUF1758 domain-containing protein n=1 Tax=Nephila pilipes TaxID=299642 RepID=A0A8X6T9P4_NEPPI|nr:DUF1758 domain-containing protein [Nephila pilipes]